MKTAVQSILSICFCCLFLASCQKDSPQSPGHERPEKPEQTTILRVKNGHICIETPSKQGTGFIEIERISADDKAVDIEITVEQEFTVVEMADMSFPEGAEDAEIPFFYNLDSGNGKKATAKAHMLYGHTEMSADIEITFIGQSDDKAWENIGTGTYRSGSETEEIVIFRQEIGHTTHYRLVGEGFERSLQIDRKSGRITVAEGAAGFAGLEKVYDSYLYLSAEQKAAKPAGSVTSDFDDVNGRLNLSVCYTDGDGNYHPRVDNIKMPGFEDKLWQNVADGLFYDGWFTGVISLEARPPLNPEEYPWAVETEMSTEQNPLHPAVRIVNPYRGACPLAEYNSAGGTQFLVFKEGDLWELAPFENIDCFGQKVWISGITSFDGEVYTVEDTYINYGMNSLRSKYATRLEMGAVSLIEH